MISGTDRALAQKETQRDETGSGIMIAALWSAFYLIAIVTVMAAPFFAGAINIASR